MFDIRCPLREAAYVSKDQKGLICPEGVLTFYEYDQTVTAAARKLRAAGVVAGERVGLAIEPGWRQPALLLAVIRAGAVACVLDPAMDRASLRERLRRVECRRLIAGDPKIRADLGPSIQVHDSTCMAELGAIGDAAGIEERMPGDRPATLIFADGPDGGFRAILHTCGNHYYSALGCNANTKLRSRDRYLFPLRMHDAEGLSVVFRCALSGATLVIPGQENSTAHAVMEGEITHASLSLQELDSVRSAPSPGRSALRLVSVREPIDAHILAGAVAAGIQVQCTFDLPEMISHIAAVPPGSPPGKQLTRGRVLKYRQVRIGSDGALWVKGHTLMAGYVEGARVLRPLDAGGWFDTGLKGRMDEDGYLTVFNGKE